MTVSASGVVNWTPAAGQTGSQPVSLTVSDGHGGSDVQTFNVVVAATGTNTPPTIDSTPRASIPLGRTYVYAAHASDVDANPLTFSLVNPPAGMTVDATTGVVLWTPTAAQVGTNTATLQVSDGQGGTVDQPLSIQVVTTDSNTAPQIVSTPTSLITVHDREYAYDLVGSDADHDPLTWRLVSGPAGMSVDVLRGTLRFTAEENQIGLQTVVVEVADTFGATRHAAVHVECGMHEPGTGDCFSAGDASDRGQTLSICRAGNGPGTRPDCVRADDRAGGDDDRFARNHSLAADGAAAGIVRCGYHGD